MAAAITSEAPIRWDFSFPASGAAGAAAVGAVTWPRIDQMNPDASTLAISLVEFDLGAIPQGQIVTVKRRGGSVFVRRRTKKEIEDAQNVSLRDLRDSQTDAQRTQKPEWLIVVGVCRLTPERRGRASSRSTCQRFMS